MTNFYFSTPAAYYNDVKKEENAVNPKPWKSLTTDEKKIYIKRLNDVSYLKLIYRRLSISLGKS
jgi:hypothetical protein